MIEKKILNSLKIPLGYFQNSVSHDKLALPLKIERDSKIIGYRVDTIIIDDPIQDYKQKKFLQTVLEPYFLDVYNYMLDTGMIAVSKTHKHTGAVSIVHYINEFRHRVIKTHNIYMPVIFIPRESLADILKYLHEERYFNIYPTTPQNDEIFIRGIRYEFYNSKVDIVSSIQKLFAIDDTIRFGVIEYE